MMEISRNKNSIHSKTSRATNTISHAGNGSLPVLTSPITNEVGNNSLHGEEEKSLMSSYEVAIPFVVAAMSSRAFNNAQLSSHNQSLRKIVNQSKEFYKIDFSACYGEQSDDWRPFLQYEHGCSEINGKELWNTLLQQINSEYIPKFILENKTHRFFNKQTKRESNSHSEFTIVFVDGISILDKNFRRQLQSSNLINHSAFFIYVPFSSPRLNLNKIIQDQLKSSSLKILLDNYQANHELCEIGFNELQPFHRWVARIYPTIIEYPEKLLHTPNPNNNKQLRKLFPNFFSSQEDHQIYKLFSGSDS